MKKVAAVVNLIAEEERGGELSAQRLMRRVFLLPCSTQSFSGSIILLLHISTVYM